MDKSIKKENYIIAAYGKPLKHIRSRKYIQLLNSQIEETKKLYPEFDFESECEDPQFRRFIKIGVPVRYAYEVMHVDDIIGGEYKRI